MYKQYQLPYAYEALEPHIDALTMETHYSKHHAAYTKNLNDAAEKAGVAGRDITELLANLEAWSAAPPEIPLWPPPSAWLRSCRRIRSW